MRIIALSIVVLSGAIMASAGTIAEALPSTRHYSIVDGFGLAVVAIGLLLLIAELFNWQPLSVAKPQLTTESRVGV